ncbi:MAG TPA: UvrY/SirA/GacA family response regulator transcription factor [Gammaproteobacteria bacterium]|nr:UvrY/SirA/GacA family response regulator transcription factor [Gammaproteobacteria bacterium]
MIKVLLVDDHELVRLGIKRLLQDVHGFKVVGEASSGEDAVLLAKELMPDVIVMDVQMPGIGGLEATRKMLRHNPDVKILALTVYEDEPYPSRFLQAGAAGYITKGCDPEEMVRAIRAIHSGQRYISPTIAQQIAIKRFTKGEDSPLDILSERELQIMLMITQGVKVQDIAKKLCLSPKTVNSYRYRIFEKLAIKSDVDLTLMAVRLGMIEGTLPETE